MSSIPPIRVLKALIVDDYPVNRRLMEILLADLGHQTIVARSGHEAVEAVRNDKFDFAFLDLQMPDMDGYQTARAIREVSGEQSPVLIACSASDDNASGDHCREAGFAALLPKPVTPESLSAVLEGRAQQPQVEQRSEQCWVIPDSLALLVQLAGKSRVTGLLELFVRESERRVDLLLKTLSEKDMEVFGLTAHSLKGSSAQMGAKRMAEISSELEHQSQNGERIRIAKLVALAKELEKVQAAVGAYLAEK